MKVVLIILGCACSPALAQAQAPATPPQYTALDLGTLGGPFSQATAINNKGQVVGSAWMANNTVRAFLYSGGALLDLGTTFQADTQGDIQVAAYGINDSGDIVGVATLYTSDSESDHAFIYRNGAMTDLASLGGYIGNAINNSGQATGYGYVAPSEGTFLYTGGSLTIVTGGIGTAINSSGQIAGQAYNGTRWFAFLYSDGTTIDLGSFGGNNSSAIGINDFGQVVGGGNLPDGTTIHAFLYSDGVMTDLGTLGGSRSSASDINNSGQVVGLAYASSSQTQSGELQCGFVYLNGTMYNLDDLIGLAGIHIWSANAINDLGQIAAEGSIDFGSSHAFLLRPITTAAGGATVRSPVSSNASYTVVPPVSNVDAGSDNTNVALVGGTSTRATTVNITFNSSTPSGFQAASDVVDVSGTGSDTIVLQISYNEAQAISVFGSEADSRLMWRDPADGLWKLAVAGNIGGLANDLGDHPYNPATDFQLGNYGVDTANNVVWAVINHNSSFAIGIPIPPLELLSAASRKTHDGAGAFDIDLPLSGAPGVECRGGNSHTLVFTFSNNVTAGRATISAGQANVSGTPVFTGNIMTINLTGVANPQRVTISLNGVTDNFSQVLPDTSFTMAVLLGDTTGDGSVNSADISQTKSRSGQSVSASNFRSDVTADGNINSADISLVKSKSGTALP